MCFYTVFFPKDTILLWTSIGTGGNSELLQHQVDLLQHLPSKRQKKTFEVQVIFLVIIFAIVNIFWMNKLYFIKSKLCGHALFSPEFGKSPSFLTEMKTSPSHSNTQKYRPLQKAIFHSLGKCERYRWNKNSVATAADVSGKAASVASNSAM